ncbi:hypothetical protein I4U23_020042 [Adineta vaga]|nr:hypothetical protein I4U23_020042 [Adineta vaga]
MLSTDEEGLSSNRIQGSSEIDLNDIQCSICCNILWKPIACQSCETPFCSKCIATWLNVNPNRCPMRCNKYIQRPCTRFITKQLAKLQVFCIHQPNGCHDIVSYEAVGKHEAQCDYQPKECSGCKLQLLKKEYIEHENSCSEVELTCDDCKTIYKRSDALTSHSDMICLKEQLRRSQEDNQQLKVKINENLQEYEYKLRKFREDCEERIALLTGMRTLWPRSLPKISQNAIWSTNAVTVAGGQGTGSSLSQLSSPFGVYVDEDQTLYVADWGNDRILEWKYGSTSGQVVAGGNGRGSRLDQLHHPTDVIVDKNTDSFIISDMNNRRVVRWFRQKDKSQEIILDNIDCTQLAMDNHGLLYVSNCQMNEVRCYQPGDTQGIVVAGGNGCGDDFNQLYFPTYLVVDGDQTVYVSDTFNHRVMKWVKGATEGIVVAGDRGKGNDWTQLSCPNGIVVDQLNRIYVADLDNHRIMRWSNGVIQLVGGNDDGMQPNQFDRPSGISFDRYGNLYVIDHGNQRVQRFDIVIN